VIRGGSWGSRRDRARAVDRFNAHPTDRFGYDGFRVMKSPTESPELRVIRGGAWDDHRGDVRTNARGWGYPVGQHDFVGFRVLRRFQHD